MTAGDTHNGSVGTGHGAAARLTADEIAAIQAEAAHYEEPRAVAVDAMRLVQARRGWIDDDTLQEVATLLGMSASELEALATFYNLIYRRPVGRHVIHVCDSMSCWICADDGLYQALRERLGIDFGGTSGDGRFTLLPIVCLGACERAPTLLIDGELHGPVNDTDIARILEHYP